MGEGTAGLKRVDSANLYLTNCLSINYFLNRKKGEEGLLAAMPLGLCETDSYRDDVQDAEKTVHAVPWEHFLHKGLFPILNSTHMYICE